MMKSGFALYRKARIHYSECGRGRALLLLHGFLESSSMWEDYARRLSDRYRVVTIDLPGHGDSECVGYVHSMEEMAEAVMSVCKKLRIRRVSILGHSMGGYVALAFADRFPDAVSRLCLFFSHAAADCPAKKKGRQQVAKLVVENHRSFIRKTLPRLFRHTYRQQHPEVVKEVMAKALQTPARGILAALEGMRIRPSREILLKFPPYPVYMLAGRRDPVLPLQTVRPQMRHSEKIKSFVLQQAGHMGHLEEPERCLQIIREFMEDSF
jgi:pimeloyl-ACP methyl ester carboxylesterase